LTDFARSTKHLLLPWRKFRSLGVQFISYQENIDTTSPLGQALFTIVSAVAAAYLGKGVRTVQRGELLHGLPVRRPKGAPHGVVYSSREELDQWLLMQWSQRHSEVHSNADAWHSTLATSELGERYANYTMVSVRKRC